MVILGISAYYHDSAAALIVDGKVVAAICEERLSRIKHDSSFPQKAIAFCVEESGLTYSDIDYIVFYEKPFRKFERILMSHIHHAPKGLRTFVKSMPIWLKERLNMKTTISKSLNEIFNVKRVWDIRFIDHHLSHAAMAYYTSPFEKAAVLVVDAVGENATTSIYKADGNKIDFVKRQCFPDSVGLLYSAFTYFLGFQVNSDEYKVMGLAPYGDLQDEQTKRFANIIKNKLVGIDEDGSIRINQKYFTYMVGLKMVDDKVWEKLFGFARREENAPIKTEHKNLAAAIQNVTEDILLRLAKHAKAETQNDNLCISGGCALNCAAMGKIKTSGVFENVFVPFAPGDDGAAIGAAMAFYSIASNKRCLQNISPYQGCGFTNKDVEKVIRENNLDYSFCTDEDLYNKVAASLSQGNIVGWFQGQLEFGPRALGNRSILADPREASMKDRVNARVKYREGFRPFAPVVTEDAALKFFDDDKSPFMMSTTHVRKGVVTIPAVTHVDQTARVQTVTESSNLRLYRLLKAFEDYSNIPILLNTSFNVMGEPIVCTPQDAIKTFKGSGIDILVINNYIIRK